MAGDGTYVSKLSEEAARGMMSFGRRRGGGPLGPAAGGVGGFEPPPITNLGGTVTFTVKDVVLTGYEVQTTGTMSFNGQNRDMGRTTKVTFEDTGSTSFDVPEAAVGALME